MRRRDFIAGLGYFSLWPVTVCAQSGGPKRIAIVAPARPVTELKANATYKAFVDELARLGFIEGQNLVVDRYSGNGQIDTYPELAREVVRTQPDAILTTALHMSLALKRATSSIPILTIVGDPVVSGLVAGMARPGGNVTGVTIDAGIEFHGKRLGLLQELSPSGTRIAYLATSAAWNQPQAAMVRKAAQISKLSLVHLDLGDQISAASYISAFQAAGPIKADTLLVSDEPEHLPNSKILIQLVTEARIPASYPFRDLVLAGGLMAYYRDLIEAFHQLATQMAKILGGANPAEMPFVQPTNFKLSINAKAAQQIGLTLPVTLLARADEVIE